MATSQTEIIHTLRQSAEEIQRLRNRMNILQIENNAYDRVLSALENHRPRETRVLEGEDFAWRASKLAEQLDMERVHAEVNQLRSDK